MALNIKKMHKGFHTRNKQRNQKKKRNSKKLWRTHEQKRKENILQAQRLEANLRKWFAFLVLGLLGTALVLFFIGLIF